MKTRFYFALVIIAAAVLLLILGTPRQSQSPTAQTADQASETAAQSDSDGTPQAIRRAGKPPKSVSPVDREASPTSIAAEIPIASTNKLERLKSIRETFTALASGDRATALRAAKQLTDENERETALLTLVTEWKQGELGPARRRARAIEAYGLDTGMAIEIANDPETASIWANEMTEGTNRVVVLQQAANNLLLTDPGAGIALAGNLPEDQRRPFLDALFASWGGWDTDSALDWANQIADDGERDAAIQAIRTAAPVGIGASLSIQDGYTVVNQLIPGSPAELSGQIHPGDRILALAQGDNSFVDARNLALDKIVQMIRGTPNTLLQLQVIPADAAADSQPRTISIVRNQIKFKR